MRSDTLQGQVLETLEQSFGNEASCSDLAKFMGKDRGNLYRELQELVSKRKIERVPGSTGREVRYRVLA